jgi:phage gp46-like protein
MSDFHVARRASGFLDLAPAPVTGLAEGRDLETHVRAILFTWGRARVDDVLPGFDADRKGYWADAFPAVQGRGVGTRLWIYARAVLTDATVAAIEETVREDLQQLIDDGLARTITVQAARVGDPVRLDLAIRIVKPDGNDLDILIDDLWRELDP